MRWKEKKTDSIWRKRWKFAFKPVKVYIDLDNKNTCWIWLERYVIAQKWQVPYAIWEYENNYVFELFAEDGPTKVELACRKYNLPYYKDKK